MLAALTVKKDPGFKFWVVLLMRDVLGEVGLSLEKL